MTPPAQPQPASGTRLNRRAWGLPLLVGAALALALVPHAGAQGTGEAAEPEASLPGILDIDLTPAEVTVGGRVEAEITLVWMGEAPVEAPRFPTWQDTWGGAEVVDASAVSDFVDQSGRYVYRQTIVLTAFEAGEVTVPAATVALPLQDRTVDVRSEPASFSVRSLLPPEPEEVPVDADPVPPDAAAPGAGDEGDALTLRPAAAAVDLESGQRRFLITLAALTLALAVQLALLLRKLGRNALVSGIDGAAPAVVDPLTLLPPLEELLARLDRIDPDRDGGGGEPAHTGLSYALRTYLGRSFGFQARESTTSEIQRRLHRSPVDPTTAHGVVALLRNCDQVKFAKAPAPPSTTAQRLDTARELARGIQASLEPSAGTSAEGEGRTGSREAA
ncbi:MAG: hypothetical protein AAGN66_18650 [Acidobacteriota bacterium]